MQLWPFMSHSGFLLESRFSDFFKFAIFSTKISLFLQIHFNLHEDKHSFGYFWTPKSTYDICSVFLYMLSYTLSPKNSKIEILFCQTLRPECSAVVCIRIFCTSSVPTIASAVDCGNALGHNCGTIAEISKICPKFVEKLLNF